MNLGATWHAEATSFAVHAPRSSRVEVCLPSDESEHETRCPLIERTGDVWHGQVPGVSLGQRYSFRVDGGELLLDPYARAISGCVSASASSTAWSVVVGDGFDWEGDERAAVPWTDTVVYELHVKGFTQLHHGVPEHLRGSYAALGSPASVEYLKDLGVTTLELLPVHQFASEPAVVGRGLVNYWGYNSIGFFAPHNAYSSSGDRGDQVVEFKQMVKNLHRAGFEVVLDVVYNHTAEGGHDGPTLSFRGLDDAGYYRGDDVTGCGNTLDASRQPAQRLILDSLRYWVTEMHVDGFRFDLAPALARADDEIDMAEGFLAAIGQDPVLRHVKLIAEPWDLGEGGYQLGSFPPPWCEWNDRYRDSVRDFWRGSAVNARDLANRLAGSGDLYSDDATSPHASINFVTAHDGFTLRDLVSYDAKHNEANSEESRDGSDHNRSWNCGVEGPTDDPETDALRRRQAANLMATLCLSAGVPMITAGDERGRTQSGNNNAYCQDNEISWVDWTPDDAWLDLHRLTRDALRLRREHPELRQLRFADDTWLHPDGREMTDADWSGGGRTLGLVVSTSSTTRDSTSRMVVWFNAEADPVRVRLPEWLSAAEVVLSTDEGHPPGERFAASESVALAARSLVVLRELASVRGA